MVLRKRRKVTFEWTCRCERCGHAWRTVRDKKPERCPGCMARGWEKPARPYVRRKVSE